MSEKTEPGMVKSLYGEPISPTGDAADVDLYAPAQADTGPEPIAWLCFDKVRNAPHLTLHRALAELRESYPNDWQVEPLFRREDISNAHAPVDRPAPPTTPAAP